MKNIKKSVKICAAILFAAALAYSLQFVAEQNARAESHNENEGFFGLAPAPQQSGTSDLLYSLETYGLISAPTIADVVTTNGTNTITSQTGSFAASDVGLPVLINGFAAGTTIASVQSGTSATLSVNSNYPLETAAVVNSRQAMTILGRQATPLNLHGGALTLATGSFSNLIFGTGTMASGSAVIANTSIMAGQNVYATAMSGTGAAISGTCSTGTMTFLSGASGDTRVFSYWSIH